jgi:L-alanine-DL-glutamate epimerase-like enolase superfamily enzyme
MTAEATVHDVTAEVYEVPTDQPEADGTLAWTSTTMVVVRARAAGSEGLGWTYSGGGSKSVVDEKLAGAVEGRNPFDIPAANEAMVRACRNLGRPGLASCAISAVDVALWDLKARLMDVPLASLLGKAHAEVPLYGSGGFTTYSDKTTSDQLEHWVTDWGLPRVKIKIGESWGHETERDLHRVSLTRQVVGDSVDVYVDANGGYTRKQAVRMGHALAGRYGVTWFEEPVSSDDLAGLREVRDQCTADVAAGEYGYSPMYFAPMIAAGAVDCVQADVTRCGGVTGWLAVAHLAAANGLQISGHCAPNLHGNVALAAPNLRHLEYFHDHVRIESMLVDGTMSPNGGALRPSDDAGHGMSFRDVDATPYRVA